MFSHAKYLLIIEQGGNQTRFLLGSVSLVVGFWPHGLRSTSRDAKSVISTRIMYVSD